MSFQEEYEAVRGTAAAGLLDLSARGRVEVSGTEAVMFLNGLISNDVKTLADGAWMTAAFPDVKGRLVAFARVINREGKFLLDTEAATRDAIYKTLERFTFAGDFQLRDLAEELALVSVQGARANEIIAKVFGDKAAQTTRGAAWLDAEKQTTIIRDTHTGEDGFDIFINVEDATRVQQSLIDAGARPVTDETLELLRIEAGIPRYGADMNAETVVLETGLDDAVSYTKGCYIGQEIIARIHYRGHVARKLAGVLLDEVVEVPAGSKVMHAGDGKEIGRTMSATVSPRLNRAIALSHIRYAYLADGTEAKVVINEQEHMARVVALPFVRGSWHSDDDNAAEVGATTAGETAA